MPILNIYSTFEADRPTVRISTVPHKILDFQYNQAASAVLAFAIKESDGTFQRVDDVTTLTAVKLPNPAAFQRIISSSVFYRVLAILRDPASDAAHAVLWRESTGAISLETNFVGSSIVIV